MRTTFTMADSPSPPHTPVVTYTRQNAAAVGRFFRGFLHRHQIGLSAGERRTLPVSALLHDLAKIFLSYLLLKKPEPLTTRERELVEGHSVTGSESWGGPRILVRS
jgi:response regulator RpfG family c-di-GMP phosphodiesterase